MEIDIETIMSFITGLITLLAVMYPHFKKWKQVKKLVNTLTTALEDYELDNKEIADLIVQINALIPEKDKNKFLSKIFKGLEDK